ncbi:Heterogeneous nuclear ribonucleoprotein K [Portunus trituberculatus]|uniref:Heterogeneous nuclear ribonucleoprotein K n=1 Tax=Portunus trituberculatus TaxID=210409 RepID=A0A5B7EZG7_PORTR|nr:Heterogeneous nuclear ribonucleoprotein K [Portunus trituberculatus]
MTAVYHVCCRVLTIGGSEEVVLKVLNEVLQCLDEALQKGNESDARILVHQSQAGCIIGKAGSKIKELREVSSDRRPSPHCSYLCHYHCSPSLPRPTKA